MPLSSMRLRNFRCFPSLACSLPAGTVLFVGDNAQGKTSVLEAVCVLLRLQSPRSQKPAEWMRFGEDNFGLAGTLDGRELRYTFMDGERQLSVEGSPVRKSADYLAASGLVVWMGNGDLELVTGSSEPRRRYLDFLGAQLFSEYRPALTQYEKALRSRNFLLKRDAVPAWRQIDAYTQVLAEHGAVLTRLRSDLTTQLLPHAASGHAQICRSVEHLGLTYLPASGADLAATLAGLREEESRRRVTLAGPHRDDLSLTIDGRPAQQFGSEGQQRTVALSLKLAQATLLQAQKEQPPILLLDDIFGELDPSRRNALLAALPVESQRLITTTHLQWMDETLTPAAVFHVHRGVLTPTG